MQILVGDLRPPTSSAPCNELMPDEGPGIDERLMSEHMPQGTRGRRHTARRDHEDFRMQSHRGS